ncbi:MAG: BtpA/SgcQ family protein [Bdellovibrionales bacterium]|nr:BtpA/SgcQ family protein [Bdellovibrionales bacterium]
MKKLPRWICVIHLAALPGSPGATGKNANRLLDSIVKTATTEAKTLEAAGFSGLILENFGDAPFFPETVPAETVASMAQIAREVVRAVKIPVGINVLRNDCRSALAIAATSGASFIRVNVLSGVAATDQGMIQGRAAEWIRYRNQFCPDVRILADILVKHARTLSVTEVDLAVEEVGLRAHADGVIVTGPTTGRAMERGFLKKAYEAASKHEIPLWIGSGTTIETLPWMVENSDGLIVGSTLRRNGRAGAPLDPSRIRSLMNEIKKVQKQERKD